MKTVFIFSLASAFLLSGAFNIFKQVKITKALDEIVSFINIVRTEVHYTTADFENILLKGKTQNYKHIFFSDNGISVDKSVGERIEGDFNGFVNKIGTTDEYGQISICEEYKERFQELLAQRKMKEKENLQVKTALSVFGALTVLIFFL